MATLVKRNFFGGFNQQIDPSKLDPESEFYLLSNSRVRDNTIRPVALPDDLTAELPEGLLQGLYAVDPYIIAFIDGLAYYANAEDPSVWNQIESFQMSATAANIYLELVPASTVNYARTAADATDASAGVKLGSTLDGSPHCAVVMDGVSQPWIIFPNATARVTQSYAQWMKDTAQEYVPIATYPMYYNGILYCVGKDSYGRLTQIYRSVSGRPLDFMVVIDVDGNKTTSEEQTGGAPQVAYGVSYHPITCLRTIDIADGAFLVTTAQNSYLVTPNYSKTIFGEPTFNKQFLFSIGALNQECVTDILGDTALIHYAGIRSFNGTGQLRNEGKNDPFSIKINSLLADITQTTAAATSFDNYAMFAVTTKYGPGILLYDTLTKTFTSLDIYPNVTTIVQFTSVRTQTVRKLFFRTSDNKLYEAFASEDYATAGFYWFDMIPEGGSKARHRIKNVHLLFSECSTEGYIQCSTFVDHKLSSTQAQTFAATISAPVTQASIPFTPLNSSQLSAFTFAFDDSAEHGWQAGTLITWNTDAKLLEFQIETDEVEAIQPDDISSAPAVLLNPERFIFIGSDATVSAIRDTVHDRILLEPGLPVVIGVGDHYDLVNGVGFVAGFVNYWDKLKQIGRFYACPGNTDLFSDNGVAFYQYMRPYPPHYFQLSLGNFVNIFLCVDGFKSNNGVQCEPDNVGATPEDYPQYVWLYEKLAASTTKFNVVCWHQSPWTSNNFYWNGNTTQRQLNLKTNGAHALVCGHTRALERLILSDGLPIFNSGGGGIQVGPIVTQYEPLTETKFYSRTYGYLLMKAWPHTLEFTFKDSTGTAVDQWIVIK